MCFQRAQMSLGSSKSWTTAMGPVRTNMQHLLFWIFCRLGRASTSSAVLGSLDGSICFTFLCNRVSIPSVALIIPRDSPSLAPLLTARRLTNITWSTPSTIVFGCLFWYILSIFLHWIAVYPLGYLVGWLLYSAMLCWYSKQVLRWWELDRQQHGHLQQCRPQSRPSCTLCVFWLDNEPVFGCSYRP